MQPIVALGCGLVGEYVIHRLADDGFRVVAVDLRVPRSLTERSEVSSIEQDAKEYIDSLNEPTIVINMLPGRIGHSIRENLIRGGHNIVDLAFTEEDPQTLDTLAKEHRATMIWDIGIAPGLSNMLLAQAQRELGHLDEVSIHVGGNPIQPDDEWSYMAPFSPSDVIEENTRGQQELFEMVKSSPFLLSQNGIKSMLKGRKAWMHSSRMDYEVSFQPSRQPTWQSTRFAGHNMWIVGCPKAKTHLKRNS